MTSRHVPETLEEALHLLATLDDVMIYGGGTAIQILTKQGILFAENLLDISRVPQMADVSVTEADVTVGAMVSLRRMETDPSIVAAIPLAAKTYAHVANPRVRNTATVAGNIAHGDYRLDPPTALLALDAAVLLASEHGTREVPIREFFVDFQITAVEREEMITAIRIPRQPAGAPGEFVKYSSLSVNDWPCASAAALAVPDGDAWQLRLGLGALAPTSLYLAFEVSSGMSDQEVVDAAIEIADSAMDPIPDVRGGAEYKARLGRVAVEEAVRGVMKEVQHA